MPQDAHPLDHLTAGLIDVYAAQTRRLEAIVRAGLSQGLTDGQPGAASLAYRQRALAQAKDQLAALTDITHRGVKPIIGSAYGAALTVTDRHLAATGQATTGMIGTFGRLDVRAVETAVAQLDGALTEAARQVGERIDDVFTAAAAIADGGPLPKTPFLGRRFNDELRRFTLEAVAGGTVALDTRRQVSQQLAQRLIREGVTTATAGIIDRGGRRWSLDHYAAMAARTTTREIASEATINRMVEHGADLVAISSHPHAADECSPYDGKTFSISGTHPTYPKLDRRPPFHPNCRHVVTPAGANLDEFEAALGNATGHTRRPVTTTNPAIPPTPTVPAVDLTDPDILDHLISRAHRGATEQNQGTRIENALRNGRRDDLRPEDKALLASIEADPKFRDTIKRIGTLKAQAAEAANIPDTDTLIATGKTIMEQVETAGGAARTKLAREIADARAEFAELLPHGPAASAEAGRRLDDLVERLAAIDRDNLTAALREARPGFGEGTITNFHPSTSASGRQKVEDAAKYLPREWVEDANATSLEVVDSRRVRPYYKGVENAPGRLVVKPDESPSVVLHELTHRMQAMNPKLGKAEEKFYRRRVTGPNGKLQRKQRINLEPVNGGQNKEVFRGAWTNAYTGRDYAITHGRATNGPETRVDPKEISPMAIQGVFYGEHSIALQGTQGVRALSGYRHRKRQLETTRSERKLRPTEAAELARITEVERLIENGDPELAHFIVGALATL